MSFLKFPTHHQSCPTRAFSSHEQLDSGLRYMETCSQFLHLPKYKDHTLKLWLKRLGTLTFCFLFLEKIQTLSSETLMLFF